MGGCGKPMQHAYRAQPCRKHRLGEHMCMYKLAAGEVIAGGWQHGQHPSALAEMDALL